MCMLLLVWSSLSAQSAHTSQSELRPAPPSAHDTSRPLGLVHGVVLLLGVGLGALRRHGVRRRGGRRLQRPQGGVRPGTEGRRGGRPGQACSARRKGSTPRPVGLRPISAMTPPALPLLSASPNAWAACATRPRAPRSEGAALQPLQPCSPAAPAAPAALLQPLQPCNPCSPRGHEARLSGVITRGTRATGVITRATRGEATWLGLGPTLTLTLRTPAGLAA